jgi:type I restriction enzyme S subunit
VIDISTDHLAIVRDILSRVVPEAEVRVFGSRATGTAKPHSDLDLALKADGKIDKKILRELQTAFEESDLPFRVDAVDMAAISENFRAIITAQAVPLPFQK